MRLSLLSPSCRLAVSIDPEEKESLQFGWFLSSVYSILVTYVLHRKKQSINNNVVAEQVVVEEDLVVQKVSVE